jgi:hypothetical protein
MSYFLDLLKECRMAFEDARLAAYDQAAEACRGALLNRRGQNAGVDAYELFMGTERRAQAYASPELKEWWYYNRRTTYTQFRAEWLRAVLGERW